MRAAVACAHAKFTGEVGVCMATSGPGAIHPLSGLHDAKLDSIWGWWPYHPYLSEHGGSAQRS